MLVPNMQRDKRMNDEERGARDKAATEEKPRINAASSARGRAP